eukprot:2126502-Amphidinium_carterae.1
MAALRMLRARCFGIRMTLQSANVLLTYTWLILALYGPCLPVLNGLIFCLAKVYILLLFGSLRLLNTDRIQKYSAGVHSLGFRSVALLALAMQSSNLPCEESQYI